MKSWDGGPVEAKVVIGCGLQVDWHLELSRATNLHVHPFSAGAGFQSASAKHYFLVGPKKAEVTSITSLV